MSGLYFFNLKKHESQKNEAGGSALAACQKNMEPAGKIAGTIERETAVVENQVSAETLIAYLSDTETGNESAFQIESAVQTIEEVTGGSTYAIGTQAELPADYGTVFLGFSSLSSELPLSLTDFLEQNDFSEKTMIPFIISDGRDLTGITGALYELEPESEFLDGYVITGGNSGELKTGLEEWLSDLGYNR